MKRWKRVMAFVVILVFFVIPIFLSGSLGVFSVSHAKLIYSSSSEQFNSIALQVLEQGSESGITLPDGVKGIDYYESQSGCVDFYMGGFGLAPSGSYWGVIYTVEDAPIGFQGVELDYIWDGEGWYWQEENGDNHSYVTKLDDHWYLYKMSF